MQYMMEPKDLIKYFYRSDIFAVQADNGSYYLVKRSLTPQDLQDHIDGKVTLGAYQVKDETVQWAVIDFDSYDYKDTIYSIAQDLSANFEVEIEDSGQKGYHIWIWFLEPQPMFMIYDFLHGVLADYGLKPGFKSHIDIFPRAPYFKEKLRK